MSSIGIADAKGLPLNHTIPYGQYLYLYLYREWQYLNQDIEGQERGNLQDQDGSKGWRNTGVGMDTKNLGMTRLM